ncbi:MAG: LysR family transcriptional regulator [Clostridiales bacterium]|nr:LysR family transcriptional regulator [Candidatus Crickella merdequi]
MLDFRVDTFLCVCKHMNYTRAADELGLTQPAVSQHIRYLENIYGTKLFEYSAKQLRLTPQGKLLKESLESMNHDLGRLKSEMTTMRTRRNLRIGATMSVGNYCINEQLASFISSNPELNVSVTVADTKELLSKLGDGQIDFILCEGNFDKTKYNHQLIRNEEIVPFCSSSYDTEGITTLESLFSHRIFLREEGSGTREVFEAYLRERGFSVDCFEQHCDCNSPQVITNMLKAGLGISFMYYTVGADAVDAGLLKTIRLTDFKLQHEFNAVWQKHSIYEDYYRDCIRSLL